MKAIVKDDVRIWWGAEIKKGTVLEIEMGERLWHINSPAEFNDCYIGNEVLEFIEEE